MCCAPGSRAAAWITVDDTGARHQAKNGFCTQIGNAHFTSFVTTASKSRLNFLALLRAGHGDYVVNDEALAYMRERALASPCDRSPRRTSRPVLPELLRKPRRMGWALRWPRHYWHAPTR